MVLDFLGFPDGPGALFVGPGGLLGIDKYSYCNSIEMNWKTPNFDQ